MTTKLLYLDNMDQLESTAKIVEIKNVDDKSIIIVDQTIFYPQGGGQPSDIGYITSNNSKFEVQFVSKENKEILHKGSFINGILNIGDNINLFVNQATRTLNSRLHTAGHLIDYALADLGYKFVPSRAYHFPQGPYVEYIGTLPDIEREQLLKQLEEKVNLLSSKAYNVKVKLLDNNPEQRVMFIDGYNNILCGGTHVNNTKDIGHITIRKIKNEKGNLRVSYALL